MENTNTDLIPANDKERLAALQRYDILDTPPDGSFNRLTRLAATLFNMPISIISLVDEDRIWFKSQVGVDGVEQIDRVPGLCASAILSDDLYVVEDAKNDPRTLANPLVAGTFGLRFYAAAPLKTRDGYNLGTFCLLDKQQRYLTKEQREILTELAAITMDEMEMRLSARNKQAAVNELLAEANEHLTNMANKLHQANSSGVVDPDEHAIQKLLGKIKEQMKDGVN
jgi:GAF domain-containing protein